jgi:flagellar hook assembly protein FlgD
MYGLLVQARDKSGNSSGKMDYRIDFEVITRPTITEILNYPNPFSSSTQFVFTLTGTEVPDEMKIQIMTVGGRVVREIMGYELGMLHIGRNITDYRWNGTDEFGDPLANGVYLYRVVARLNGQDLEVMHSGADVYIEKGFGKMVIIR